MPLTAVVLAAGASTRCPEGKLLKFYRGHPLIVWTIENLKESPLVGEIVVVCGHQGEEMKSLLDGVRFVENPDWESGLSSSLATGISAVEGPGALVCLGDTPFFSQETIEKVVPSESEQDEIRFPVLNGIPGHPKYFPSWLFPELKMLTGDTGAKSLLKKHRERCHAIDCGDPGTLRDFDRAEDFDRI